jgi:hypothetical protein
VIYKIYSASRSCRLGGLGNPGSGGPISCSQDSYHVYVVLKTSLCCRSGQSSHDELSVRISAASRGLAAQMDLLRASIMSQPSTTPLTSPRSQSSRLVTAYKPTSHSVQHKRSTVARSLPSQLVYQPKLSPAYHPSLLSLLAPLVPGPQSLPLSVYTLPTTST